MCTLRPITGAERSMDKKKKKKVDAHRELRVREFGQVISIITDEE